MNVLSFHCGTPLMSWTKLPQAIQAEVSSCIKYETEGPHLILHNLVKLFSEFSKMRNFCNILSKETISWTVNMSRPATGRLKVRCHANLLEHSTEGGSTCHPTSLYGHCSGDWSVWICEGHGRGRKPTEVSCWVDWFGLPTLIWFSLEEGSLYGGWPAVRRRSQPGTPVGRGRSGM